MRRSPTLRHIQRVAARHRRISGDLRREMRPLAGAKLVFVRPGELRQAEWVEFDLDGAEWRLPAGRMKAREPHLVPLSHQAVVILRELYHSPAKVAMFPALDPPPAR